MEKMNDLQRELKQLIYDMESEGEVNPKRMDLEVLLRSKRSCSEMLFSYLGVLPALVTRSEIQKLAGLIVYDLLDSCPLSRHLLAEGLRYHYLDTPIFEDCFSLIRVFMSVLAGVISDFEIFGASDYLSEMFAFKSARFRVGVNSLAIGVHDILFNLQNGASFDDFKKLLGLLGVEEDPMIKISKYPFTLGTFLMTEERSRLTELL
jgi:hypothetical protein